MQVKCASIYSAGHADGKPWPPPPSHFLGPLLPTSSKYTKNNVLPSAGVCTWTPPGHTGDASFFPLFSFVLKLVPAPRPSLAYSSFYCVPFTPTNCVPPLLYFKQSVLVIINNTMEQRQSRHQLAQEPETTNFCSTYDTSAEDLLTNERLDSVLHSCIQQYTRHDIIFVFRPLFFF